MGKRYFQNDTDQTVFIGGVMVMPRQGRDVDDTFLPPEEPQAPQPADDDGRPDLQQNLLDVLALAIKDIKPLLPGFSDETVAQLEQLEQAAEAPRKGLLEALGEEKLARAQRRAGAPT